VADRRSGFTTRNVAFFAVNIAITLQAILRFLRALGRGRTSKRLQPLALDFFNSASLLTSLRRPGPHVGGFHVRPHLIMAWLMAVGTGKCKIRRLGRHLGLTLMWPNLSYALATDMDLSIVRATRAQ